MTSMTAPNIAQLGHLDPPRPPLELVVNALLQAVVWPIVILCVSEVERWLAAPPPALVALGASYLMGMYLLNRAVRHHSEVASHILAVCFGVAAVLLLLSSIVAVGVGMLASMSISIVVIALALLVPAFIIWSALSFTRWTARLYDWKRDRLACDRCGYSLIGTLHDGKSECPECGTKIRVSQEARYRARMQS